MKFHRSPLAAFTLLLIIKSAYTAILQKGHTCRNIYNNLLQNKTSINFDDEVHDFKCVGDERYHCLRSEKDDDIENCFKWIWLEPGKQKI